jgi:hypothetical protein
LWTWWVCQSSFQLEIWAIKIMLQTLHREWHHLWDERW